MDQEDELNADDGPAGDDLPTYEYDLGATAGIWVMIPQGTTPGQIMVRNKDGRHLIINGIPHEFRTTLYEWPDGEWKFHSPPTNDRAYGGFNLILNRKDKDGFHYNTHTNNAYSKAWKLIPDYTTEWVKRHADAMLIAQEWRLRQAWKNAAADRDSIYAELEKAEQTIRLTRDALFAFRDEHPGIRS